MTTVICSCLFIIYLFSSTCVIHGAQTTTGSSESILDMLLKSIDKLLTYFRDNYQQATLDTVFGLRVIQGQCQLLIEEYERGQLQVSLSGSKTANETISEIKRIAKEAGINANMAVPHLREHDRDYFNLMSKLTLGPWRVFHPHRIVDASLIWKNNERSPLKFSESDSDGCIGELLGSGSKPSDKGCQLSKICLQKMLGLGQSGRQLQRQIFYTILSQMTRCDRYLNEYLLALTRFRSVDQLQRELCSNAYLELGDPDSLAMNDIDLFAETQFLCPSIGYFQFLRKEWLEAILAWQSKDGCFPLSADESQNLEQHSTTATLESSVVTNSNANSPYVNNNSDNKRKDVNFYFAQAPDLHIPHAYEEDSRSLKFITNSSSKQFASPPSGHIQGYLEPPSDVRSTRKSVQISVDSSANQIRQISPIDNLDGYAVHGVSHGRDYHNVIQYPQVQQDKLLNNYQHIPVPQDRYYLGVQRKLRSVEPETKKNDEWLIHDQKLIGCRSHLTSVTSAALAMYLRYVVDAGPSEFFQLRLEAFKIKSQTSAVSRDKKPVVQASSQIVYVNPMAHRKYEADNVHAHHDSLSRNDMNRQSVNLDNMAADARKYMGIYQRQWSPYFSGSNVGHHMQNDLGHNTAIIDYVNRPNMQRELPDWTIIYNPIDSVTTAKNTLTIKPTTSIPSSMYKHPTSLNMPARSEVADEENLLINVQAIDIQPDWIQRDLNHYLFAITLISIICLVVLFRYFCHRKNVCKGKGKKFSV